MEVEVISVYPYSAGLSNLASSVGPYINPVLQALYHITALRKAVYQLTSSDPPRSTTLDDKKSEDIWMALQSVFVNLQLGHSSVTIDELRKSIGWSVTRIRERTACDLWRLLVDNLRRRMKEVDAEWNIEQLFQGRISVTLKHVDLASESTSEVPFLDFAFDVRECTSLAQSFEKLVEEELLHGDNKREVEGHGLQTVKVVPKFLSFPPILVIHLKRSGETTGEKWNDYAIPEKLDLSSLMANAERESPPIFQLQCILLRSTGHQHSERYFAFIRPTPSNTWFRLMDSVKPATTSDVLQSGRGGGEMLLKPYLLVYMRETDLPSLLSPLSKCDIPRILRDKFDQEQEARRDQQINMLFHIVTDANLVNWRTTVKLDKVKTFKMPRTSTISI